MLATIDGSNDKSIRVKVVTVQLAAVSQLENTLTDFDGSTVNFVQE